MSHPMIVRLALPLALAIIPAAHAAEPSYSEIILRNMAPADGAHPIGGVTLAPSSAYQTPVIYGTAYSGGASGSGTLFQIADGKFTVLHSFKRESEGQFPTASVTISPDGATLYGTLSRGADTTGTPDGDGAVFASTLDGMVTDLHRFDKTDGSVPISPITLDKDGNLLSTTQYGGAAGAGISGVLFKLTPDGDYSVLTDFNTTSCDEGWSGVTLVGDVIYGTTAFTQSNYGSCLWQVSGPNNRFKVVVHFHGHGKTGRLPQGNLLADASGNLYGTTYYTGDFRAGKLYVVPQGGKERILHSFHCKEDGGYPDTSLVMDSAGILYGTTSACGVQGGGTVFSYDPSTGKLKTLYAFSNLSGDGYESRGAVSMDKAGNLYGTTEYGGSNGLGIIWELAKK